MISEVVKEFRLIKQEYAYDPSIFNPDDPRVARLKEVINTKLSQADRTILLLYVDCQSYRKLGKKLNLSHMTCRREVMRIREIVLQEYAKMKTAFEFAYYSNGVRHEITIHADTRDDAIRIFKTNFGTTEFTCTER